jgi:mannose-6-phosphate isomerase
MTGTYGGIEVRAWEPTAAGWTCLSESPYFLYFHGGAPAGSETLSCLGLDRFTAYNPSLHLLWQGAGAGQSMPSGGDGTWLAGVKDSQAAPTALKKVEQIYTVTKPWGEELWLSGRQPNYCFKKIRILKGHRTSLQLHREKRETNVLVKGRVQLHYRERDEKIQTVDFDAPVVMNICPGQVHRMEALSDLEFFEISTPQVDDVIRLADDTDRPNGKIQSEHNS